MDKNRTKFTGRSIEVRDGKVEKALRILSKKVQDSNILRILKEREYYEKPTQLRKRKAAAAIKRWKKKKEKENLRPTKY